MKLMSAKTLEARIHDHPKENLMFILGVMKSATLAGAGLALYAMVVAVMNGRYDALLRLTTWSASLVVTWLTYGNMSMFSNLASLQSNGRETLFLFIKSPIEFLLFAVLVETQQPIWFAWPLVFSAIAAVSWVKIHFLVRAMSEDRYEPALRPLLREISAIANKKDIPGTLAGAIVFSVVGIAILVTVKLGLLPLSVAKWIVAGCGALAHIPLAIAAKSSKAVRKIIVEYLDTLAERPLIPRKMVAAS